MYCKVFKYKILISEYEEMDESLPYNPVFTPVKSSNRL